MSKISMIKVDCPDCGKQFEVKCWDSLNSDLNPAEKEQLLAGRLFYATCSNCHSEHQIIYPILYHDMKNKVMIQLVLDERDIEAFISSVKSTASLEAWDTTVADGYRYRCVKTTNGLREKALIFDCGLDDRVIELLKIIYNAMINETQKDIVVSDMLFYHDTVHKLIVFVDEKPMFDIEIDMEKYNEVMEDEQLRLEDRSKDCFIIDKEWAQGLLLQENNT